MADVEFQCEVGVNQQSSHQNEDSHFENQRLQMFKKADEHFPSLTSLERVAGVTNLLAMPYAVVTESKYIKTTFLTDFNVKVLSFFVLKKKSLFHIIDYKMQVNEYKCTFQQTKLFIRAALSSSLVANCIEIEIYQLQDFLSLLISAPSDKSVQHQALTG